MSLDGEPVQKSIPEVFSQIWRDGGVGGFYRGFVARGVRLTAAMFILNMSKSKMEDMLEEYTSKPSQEQKENLALNGQ